MELNKWAQKTAEERSIFVAKLVDAMVYSDTATEILQNVILSFERRGFIKSIILPEPIEEMPLPSGKPEYRTIEGSSGLEIIGDQNK